MSTILKITHIRPDFRGKEKLLDYLNTDGDEVERSFRLAAEVIEQIDASIGGKNYWQLSYPEVAWLYAAVELLPSKLTAETGVGSGVSSLTILKASENFGGKLYSFDLGRKYGESEEMPVGYLVPQRYRTRWELVIGNTKDILPEYAGKIPPVDLFLHDSDHSYDHVTFELETMLQRMKRKYLIAVDNYDWTEAARDFAIRHGLNLVHMADDMCFIFP